MTQQLIQKKRKSIKTRKLNEEKKYFKIKDIEKEISKSISNNSMIAYRNKDTRLSSNSFTFDYQNLRRKGNSTTNEFKSKNMEKGKKKNYKKKPLVKSLEKSLEKSLGNSKKLKSKKKHEKKNSIKNTKTSNFILKNEISKIYKKNKLKSKTITNLIKNEESFNISKSNLYGNTEREIEDKNFLGSGELSTEEKNLRDDNYSFEKKEGFILSNTHSIDAALRKNQNFQYHKMCTSRENNTCNINTNNITIDYDLEKKKSECNSKEDTEPENVILKLKKYATLRQELSILNEKSFESSSKIDNNFKLKSKKNLATLKKDSTNSKCFSNRNIKNGNKEEYTDSLVKKNTHKKNKLSKSDEKKSTSFKRRYLSESKNKVKKYNTTKVNGKLFKQKKKRSIESTTDIGIQTTRSLYTKHVYITDNIEVLEMNSENRSAAHGKNQRSIVDELKNASLEKQKKDRYQENEDKLMKSMGSSKSMKSLGTIDEYKEGELTNRGKGKIENYLNGVEEKVYTHGIGYDNIENSYEKEGKIKEHKECRDYRDIYFSDLGSADILEIEIKSDKYVEVDPMKAKVDALLNKYINYKRKVYKNQKKKSKLIIEPIQIKEKPFKIDTIKFMSSVKENNYYDDIVFFFDNYELKKKKNDDLMKLFKKLFKSEYFELDGIRSLLIIYDRILKKLEKSIETYPVKSIFSEAVKEAEKQREEERMQKKALEFKALYNNEKLKEGLVLDRFVTVDKQGCTHSIASVLSLLNATDNLVEVKIKRLTNSPYTHVNNLNNSYTNNNSSTKFIPLLLRKHWHDQKKLCILKQKLEEMKRRKTPKYLQITNTKTDTKKCCPLNFLGQCLGYLDDQKNSNNYDVHNYDVHNYDVQYITLPNSHINPYPRLHLYPQYSYDNYHMHNSCCCSSKRQSYKISDAIHFLSS